MKKILCYLILSGFCLLLGQSNLVCDSFKGQSCDQLSFKTIHEKVKGTEKDLWTPVSEIEDGAVYMIRSAENPNLYWDVRNGVFSVGTPIQLYDYNCSASQKFYFKKQFSLHSSTYSLSPLYAYDRTLRFPQNKTNDVLKIGNIEYKEDNDNLFFSDKLRFEPCEDNPKRFVIYYEKDVNGKRSYVTSDSLVSGKEIINVDRNTFEARRTVWEIVKTDYLGLNVGNRVKLCGAATFRFVAKVPYPGRYVIETKKYSTKSYNTILRLVRDEDGVTVASDDNSGDEKNAKILYYFPDAGEYSVYLSGYDGFDMGSCYLILRPEKTVYMSGCYCIRGEEHIESVTTLQKTQKHLREMGYFPEVYVNRGYETVFQDSDWEQDSEFEDTIKADKDYYVYYGHGSETSRFVYFYNESYPDFFYSRQLPALDNTNLIVWMACCAGDNQKGKDDSMAYQSVKNGAKYSIGFPGNIYNLSGDTFLPALFEALKTQEVPKALKAAVEKTRKENWFYFIINGDDTILKPNLFYNAGGKPEVMELSSEKRTSINSVSDYSVSYGVVHKRGCSKNEVFTLKNEVLPEIMMLERVYDRVTLFAGVDAGVLRLFALCVDETNCHASYVDVKSGEIVEPSKVEEVMGISETEVM